MKIAQALQLDMELQQSNRVIDLEE